MDAATTAFANEIETAAAIEATTVQLSMQTFHAEKHIKSVGLIIYISYYKMT